MKIRSFKLWIRKATSFVKRNVYSFAIVLCVLVGITMVVTTVVVSNNRNYVKNNQTITIPEEPNNPVVKPDDDPIIPVGGDENDPIIPVGGNNNVVFVKPLETYTLGQEYAKDKLIWSKTLKQWQTHLGVDMITSEDSKVMSVYDGVIEKIENDILYGTCITIKHSDSLKTVYKSLSSKVEVQEGDTVKKGDIIGYASTSAISEQKEGVHLHFEVIEDGQNIDPLKYFASESK